MTLTTRRLALRGLPADVREMDAERMEFGDAEFDFVWSWGVIHHSAHTDRLVREVARVLKPGGEFRFMVYHRQAFDSYTKMLRGLLTGKRFRSMSVDDILSFYTDGYLARFYTRPQLADLINANGLNAGRVRCSGKQANSYLYRAEKSQASSSSTWSERSPPGQLRVFCVARGHFFLPWLANPE